MTWVSNNCVIYYQTKTQINFLRNLKLNHKFLVKLFLLIKSIRTSTKKKK